MDQPWAGRAKPAASFVAEFGGPVSQFAATQATQATNLSRVAVKYSKQLLDNDLRLMQSSGRVTAICWGVLAT